VIKPAAVVPKALVVNQIGRAECQCSVEGLVSPIVTQWSQRPSIPDQSIKKHNIKKAWGHDRMVTRWLEQRMQISLQED
jgi:hypothetical protein